MYTGRNPTALKSQEMFMDALTELMREKAFADISVRELCRNADLSRQTFYLLFSTKENILDLRFERVFTEYADLMLHEPNLTTQKVANWFVEFLQSESEFIRQIVDNNLSPIMLQHFQRYLFRVDDMILSRERPLRKYAIAFLAGALVEVAAEYVQDEVPPPAPQISKMICQVLMGEYFNMSGVVEAE